MEGQDSGLGKLSELKSHSIERSYGQHDVLPEIVDEAIVKVVRENTAEQLDCQDSRILEEYDWDGAEKRRQKWMWTAADYVTRSTANWKDRYNESTAAVAVYMETCNSQTAVHQALRSGTFNDSTEIGIPRGVMYEVDKFVRQRDDVSVAAVREQHREAVEYDDAPLSEPL